MTKGVSSLLIDATQVRDLHSGVARRLTSLWPHVFQQNPGVRFGVVAYESMLPLLNPVFSDIDVYPVTDYGRGPLVRKRHLNPVLDKLRHAQGFTWLHQDGFVAAPGKTIVAIHDLRSLDAEYAGWWRRQSARHLLRRMHRDSIPIITVSEHTRNAISKSLGQKKTGIHVVPNGVDTARFASASDHDNLKELNLTPGRFRLFVGHLEKRKNLGFLVELQRRLVRQDPGAVLVISTHCREEAADSVEWLARLNAESGVVVCNDLNDEQLGGLYRHASCFLMPSMMEGFSITPLEALAMETPVVLSDIGPHKEIYGRSFCFPLEIDVWVEAIEEAESDLGRPKQVMEGEKIVAAHTWEKAADAMTAILRELA